MSGRPDIRSLAAPVVRARKVLRKVGAATFLAGYLAGCTLPAKLAGQVPWDDDPARNLSLQQQTAQKRTAEADQYEKNQAAAHAANIARRRSGKVDALTALANTKAGAEFLGIPWDPLNVTHAQILQARELYRQVEQEEIRRFNATSYTPPPLPPSYPQPITPLVGRRELEMLNTSALLPLILGIKDKSAVWFQQELHLSKRDSDDLAKMILLSSV
jgi:hypothetical protein